MSKQPDTRLLTQADYARREGVTIQAIHNRIARGVLQTKTAFGKTLVVAPPKKRGRKKK